MTKYANVLEKQEIDLQLSATLVGDIGKRYLRGASVELHMARIEDGKARFDTVVDTRAAMPA